MRKQLLIGALIACSLSVAQAQGGIFGRGGGCPNGTCSRGYAGSAGYSSYYATNGIKSPSDVAVDATPTAPVVANNTQLVAPAAPQVENTTRTTNVYNASAPRGRFFRRWSR